MTVQNFTEKPTESEAKTLIEQNALWNCGVFAFKLDFILTILEQRGFPLDYQSLLEQYEERRWGWYKVLDHLKTDENYEVLRKRIGVKAGKNLSYQYHQHRSEVWTIIRGEGVFVQNDKLRVVHPGDGGNPGRT